ncbi:MAG: hypothetical protein WBG71_02600 [Leeuwenhoekiella sp.]
MKTAILYVLLTISTVALGQDENKKLPKANVTEMSITTDDLDELKNMDWDLLLSPFAENKDENEEISVSLKYEIESKKKGGVKVEKSMKVKVDGTAAELEKLKADLVKLTGGIINAMEKKK